MSGWQKDIQEYLGTAISRQLTSTSPRAAQPDCMRVTMRPHQLTLLAAARDLEKAAVLRGGLDASGEARLLTNYGVLADRVGAGKTLVAMALAADPAPEAASLVVRASGGAQLVSMRGLSAVRQIDPNRLDMS